MNIKSFYPWIYFVSNYLDIILCLSISCFDFFPIVVLCFFIILISKNSQFFVIIIIVISALSKFSKFCYCFDFVH